MRPVVVALCALCLAIAGGPGSRAVGAHGHSARPRTVTMGIRYSRFSRAALTVRVGDAVRFVVHNDDPIDHELIVGDDAVQQRHELGTGTHPGDVAGEVSVPALSRASTAYVFDRVGTLAFACHLPGHFAYGMHGVIRVVNR